MENENKGAVRVEGNKTPRLTFSVSREFESILPEIESMPNMSRFVCEAIYEKLQRTKNPNKDLEDALAHFVQIQSIIGRPITPSGIPSEPTQQQWTPPVQTHVAPPPPSVSHPVDSSVQTEKNVESPLSSDESASKEPPKVVSEEVVKEEVIEQEVIEPEVNVTLEEQQKEEANSSSPQTQKPTTTFTDIEDEEEEDDLSDFKNNFLKPRASR